MRVFLAELNRIIAARKTAKRRRRCKKRYATQLTKDMLRDLYLLSLVRGFGLCSNFDLVRTEREKLVSVNHVVIQPLPEKHSGQKKLRS